MEAVEQIMLDGGLDTLKTMNITLTIIHFAGLSLALSSAIWVVVFLRSGWAII